jgi:hypothetical protein
MSNQFVAEAASYTARNKHVGRTSMRSVGFELTIPTTKWPQTNALDRAVTGIGTVIKLPS